MPLRVPPQPRRLYATNPLKLVICQIRHPLNVRFEEPGFIVPAQELLAADYPRVTQEQQLTFPFVFGMPAVGAPAPSIAPGTETLWRFQDSEGNWSVAVSRAFLSLETTAYRRYEEFQDRLTRVLEVLEALGVRYRERLGVRYINEIRHPDAVSPRAWRVFLNPDVLGLLGGDDLGDDVITAAQDIRLREPDAIFVIKHGYVGPEVSPDAQPLYQIDLDIADETPGPLDATATLTQVNAFHERIKNVFELSITDALREHLVVQEVLDA